MTATPTPRTASTWSPTLADLASRVRADDPSVVYTARHEEAPRADEFDVGFLVRDTVDILSVSQIGANAIFSLDGSLLNDRPPLVLEAAWRGRQPALPLTVVAVHQRSLIGIDDPEDGERVRRKRHEQAVWLAGWIQQRQGERPDERLIVVGDFNAFAFTDGYVDVMGQVTGLPDPRRALIPAVEVLDPPLTDWVGSLPAAERYSYVFDGDAEALDHVLTTDHAGGRPLGRDRSRQPRRCRRAAGPRHRSVDRGGQLRPRRSRCLPRAAHATAGGSPPAAVRSRDPGTGAGSGLGSEAVGLPRDPRCSIPDPARFACRHSST